MKKRLLVSFAIVAVLAGGFFWFWSLSSMPAEEESQVTLRVERSPVSVRASGGTTFEEAVNGMVLQPGATVKTGEGGEAVIVFFEQAESRLDANSEVTISAAERNSNDPTKSAISLDLGLGRIWSRVLRLFDLDSSFSVKTSSVVATVRGTTFDIQANADDTTEVWVSDSAVTVTPKDGSDTSNSELFDGARTKTGEAFSATTTTPALAAGESASYGKDGKPQWRKPIPKEDLGSRWFTQNSASDSLFIQRLQDERRKSLKRLGGTRPDQPTDVLTRASERFRLSVTDDEKGERLANRFLARRLAKLVELAEAGKAGLASQEFARLENDVRTRLKGAEGAKERRRIKIALSRIAILVDDASPSSPLYPFKQRIEDLSVLLQQDDRPAMLYTRLLAVDSRLDEATRLIDDNMLEEARNALNAARGGIENVSRDAEPLLSELDKAQKAALLGKILALTTRESIERGRLQAAIRGPEPLPVTPTSTTATTTTTPIVPKTPPPTTTTTPPPPTAPTAPTATPEYTSIAVYAQPNPATIGSVSNLTVIGTRPNGTTSDVTARSSYRLISGNGNLNGPQFTPTTASTAVIEATLNDNGTLRTGRVTLNVSGGMAVLQSLNVTASKTTLYSGDSVALSATAVYSNGYSKDVTGFVTWQNSATALGTVSGSSFTAAAQGSGSAGITGTFTEAGVTKTGTVYLTVTEQTSRTNPLY